MPKKKLVQENIEEIPSSEQPEEMLETREETEEQVEKIPEEEVQRLRKEIEETDLDGESKIQAETHAQEIKSLQENQKVNRLLEIAKDRGVDYAVRIVREMKDPYLLDKLHDKLHEILEEEGNHKK